MKYLLMGGASSSILVHGLSGGGDRSSHNIRRMLGINNSLLGFRPPQSLRALPDRSNDGVMMLGDKVVKKNK